MKALLFLLVFFYLFSSCRQSIKAKPPNEIKYRQVLVAQFTDPSTIGLNKNKLVILSGISGDSSKAEFVASIYVIQSRKDWSILESDKDTINSYSSSKFVDKKEAEGVLKEIKNAPVFFENAFKPAISYYQGQDIDTLNTAKPKELICEKLLIHKEKELFYSICKGQSKYLVIYDRSSQKTFLFEHNSIPVNVIDFFVYDVTGDDRDEIILLTENHMSRPNPVNELTVYSPY